MLPAHFITIILSILGSFILIVIAWIYFRMQLLADFGTLEQKIITLLKENSSTNYLSTTIKNQKTPQSKQQAQRVTQVITQFSKPGQILAHLSATELSHFIAILVEEIQNTKQEMSDENLHENQ